MADLNVEKKKKSPIGWVILGIVVVALVIWFVASDTEEVQDTAQFNQEQEQTSEYGQEQSQAVAPYDANRSRTETNSAVQEFVVFAEESSEDDMNPQTVQQGITKLADALIAVANEQTQGQGTWEGELDQIKQEINQLQDENLNQQHSTVIRSAFSSAANVIQNIQNQYYPGLENEASNVMDAAQEIDDQELASEQKDEIHSFFEEAANVLEKMEERSITTSVE